MTENERKEKRAALKRYEDMRRQQLGAATNLTFGLAAGGVVFCASLLTTREPAWSSPGNYIFIASAGLFIVAVCLGILISWTRLKDFRLTARKLRLQLRGADQQDIEDLSSQTACLGCLTWSLYRWQLIVFGLAAVCLVISLSLMFGHHIFP
jgi:hypothetical protein